ncbi:MAG TPA: protein kinase [Kofleriaceae bacterium]|nr:protein kinase [Kofleriaceae bacterium]
MVRSCCVPLQEGDLEHYPRKFGKYHLLGPLAQGGMGALYLAVTGDRGLERLMVIKTVLPHLADAEYVARFRDEAKVVVKLSHGNLIPVFDAGLVGGELFLAMDFVEGRDLRAVWNRCAKKQVAFPIDVAVYIVKELCRGLAYAHSFPDLNLVHRDISPPNVLVSYTGEVKLTDFGLASSTLKLEKTAPGIIYGKVAYMSPEQARGEKLDGRSDMYAAAIVLWELLTGRQLFPPGKDQPQDLLARAKNPEVMRPSKRAPRVPAELDEICLRALAADKKDRYADCDEMRMALQTWLAHNAPTTDGTRMSSFLQDLFAEDILRERAERAELIARVRTRALTLPPTDELRMWVEKSEKSSLPDDAFGEGEPPVRKPGSVGRRATDRGAEGEDRRREADRRAGRAAPNPVTKTNTTVTAAALAENLEEAEADLIGMEVDGRYRVIELIGEGGMGKVYLAEHIEIGKRVALKVLHPSYSRMPDLVERFRREARAASKIGHPNIVDVTDSGTTADGSVYFVMEYLEGVELGSVIEREGALDVARALKISGQICRALSAAHAQGIVHRDLKPENIFLITRDGAADVVKVLDFGIAKTTEAEAARERRLTSPGMAMGTPEYMSPEQAAGRPADARCDVYALGAIMYEMVTGIPPYTGDNFMEILTKKATQDPTPPHQVRKELPGPVSDLVVSAMARNPDARPQTMETLEYELNKCLSGRGVAVAQILGMTTDPTVVATLNPGLSMRSLDDGIVVPRPAQPASPALSMTRATTQSGPSQSSPASSLTFSNPNAMNELPGMWSGPASITTTGPLLGHGSRPTSEPTATTATAVAAAAAESMKMPAMRASSPSLQVHTFTETSNAAIPQFRQRSALGVFGWLLLAAVLFGGIGALLYVAFGERGERAPNKIEDIARPPQSGAGAITPGSGSDALAPTPTPPPTGANKGSAQTPNTNGKPSLKLDDKAQQEPATVKKPATNKQPVKKLTVAEERDPKALIKQGKLHEKNGDWELARNVYEKLEKLKGQGANALYMQAWAAFQANQVKDAQELARRAAAQQTGAAKLSSMMLYGDALFKDGAYDRAKTIYSGMRRDATADMKATLAKKIVSCNKQLKLPENDGL